MSMAPNIFATALMAEPAVGTGYAVVGGAAATGDMAVAC